MVLRIKQVQKVRATGYQIKNVNRTELIILLVFTEKEEITTTKNNNHKEVNRFQS